MSSAAAEEAPRRKRPGGNPRLRVDVHLDPGEGSSLRMDALRGLSASYKNIPSKYLYDARGSELFAQICDLPEYYPTRTEHALLRSVADRIIVLTKPTDIVELGSGDARKTRALLDVVDANGCDTRYVPIDVGEGMLRNTAASLLEDYRWLTIHGIVGDYERHLAKIPAGKRKLFLFLGSTIGNLNPSYTHVFLRNLASHIGPDDRFLLGTDLVKPRAVLEAAYNDSSGVTAAFNLNMLNVLNRELDADFDPDDFEHVAFWKSRASRIEIQLRARRTLTARVEKLGRSFHFAKGEAMQTEISRKYTEASVAQMLQDAGLKLRHWFPSENNYFALSLSALA